MRGVAAKCTRLRPSSRSSVASTGMLPTAICAAGSVAVSRNTLRMPGSSQQGRKRRASEFSNWVYSAVAGPVGVS